MPKKKTQSQAAVAQTLPFEDAMERVEAIVDAMESDSLQLEEMLVQYEEGARLLAQCQDRIDVAQKRVEVIASERKNGSVSLKTFDGTEDATLESPENIEQSDSLPSETDPDSEEGSDDIRLF